MRLVSQELGGWYNGEGYGLDSLLNSFWVLRMVCEVKW